LQHKIAFYVIISVAIVNKFDYNLYVSMIWYDI